LRAKGQRTSGGWEKKAIPLGIPKRRPWEERERFRETTKGCPAEGTGLTEGSQFRTVETSAASEMTSNAGTGSRTAGEA